jgi:hypothetical protein
MNYYLQIDYWSYGRKALFSIINGGGWLENKVIFPRVVYCDFTIRYMGDNNPNYTVRINVEKFRIDLFLIILGSMYITC